MLIARAPLQIRATVRRQVPVPPLVAKTPAGRAVSVHLQNASMRDAVLHLQLANITADFVSDSIASSNTSPFVSVRFPDFSYVVDHWCSRTTHARLLRLARSSRL